MQLYFCLQDQASPESNRSHNGPRSHNYCLIINKDTLHHTSDFTVNSTNFRASGAVHFIASSVRCLALYISSRRSLENPKSPTFTTLLLANRQFRAARSLYRQGGIYRRI